MPDRKRTLLLAGLLALLGYGSGANAEARSEGGASISPPETHARRHSGTMAIVLIVLALALAGGVATALKIKRERESDALSRRLTQGDPKRGPELALRYGCAGCHEIPGVRGPRGRVGPSLDAVATRLYLGGRLPNTPDNLVQWIFNAREVDPKSAMPVTGISKREARDMAAYLLARR
jgi:cytochrome c2